VFFRRAAASARETSFLTRPGKASIIGGSRVFLVSALVFLPLVESECFARNDFGETRRRRRRQRDFRFSERLWHSDSTRERWRGFSLTLIARGARRRVESRRRETGGRTGGEGGEGPRSGIPPV